MAAKDDIPLIYSSATRAKLAEMHECFGRETCAAQLEAVFALLARHLVAAGVALLTRGLNPAVLNAAQIKARVRKFDVAWD